MSTPIARDAKGRVVAGAGAQLAARRVSMVELCRRQARAEGVNFDQLFWQVVKRVMLEASKGNLGAARLLFDHVCEHPQQPQVAVQVNNSTAGPPLPPRVDLATWADDLAAIARDLRKPSPADALLE